MTDDHQNVLASDMSTPIKGLYVCGNTLGGRYGIGYTTPCAGNSIGWAMASGWAAGHYVAAL
jgi:predicted flavoprotein YhiN